MRLRARAQGGGDRAGHEPSGRDRAPDRDRRADRRHGQQRPARAPGIHAHRGSGGAGKRRRAGRRCRPTASPCIRPTTSTRRCGRSLAGQRRSITFGLDDAANVSCTHRASAFGSELAVTRAHRRPGTTAVRRQPGRGRPAQRAQRAGGDRLRAGRRHRAATPSCAGSKRSRRSAAACSARRAANGATVIDDSYNANPDSVRAAIDVLAQAPAPRILVLGDMGEVGTQGQQFHEEIARLRRQPRHRHACW